MKQKHILILFLIISFIIVILNEVILNEMPEKICKGDEIGQVISYLCMAYISSCLFYYVVVVLKEKRDRENINKYIYKLTKEIIGRANSVYHRIIEASNVEKTDYDIKTISREEFIKLCIKANPNDISPNFLNGASPFNAVPVSFGRLIYNNSFRNVQDLINRIFIYIPFLSSEFVSLLNEIENSEHFITASTLTFEKVNSTFEVYANGFFDFIEIIKRLEEHNENYIKIKDIT